MLKICLVPSQDFIEKSCQSIPVKFAQKNLHTHMESIHNTKFKTCGKCLSKINISKNHNIKQHERNCLIRRFLCHVCGDKCYKFHKYASHYLSTHNEGERKLDMEKVRKEYEKSMKNQIQCGSCKNFYASQITLRAHWKKSKKCSKAKTKAQSIVDRREESFDSVLDKPGEKPYKCEVCNEIFPNEIRWRIHINNNPMCSHEIQDLSDFSETSEIDDFEKVTKNQNDESVPQQNQNAHLYNNKRFSWCLSVIP